jgi:hypothetical protein
MAIWVPVSCHELPSPPAAFGMASGAHSICQPDPLASYKTVVPRRFSIRSLHPFSSSLFHFSDISYLRPLASSTSPPP